MTKNEKINLLKLARAMDSNHSVSFTYIKDGKTDGIRYGNPHAVFLYGKEGNIMVHIYQYAGASDTLLNDYQFPVWRMFCLENLRDIKVIAKSFFTVEPTYNPDWWAYEDSIYKYCSPDGVYECR